LSHIYLGAVGFGVTLLVASLFLHGGKDTGHSHDSPSMSVALGWAPVTSLRFWVFFFAFGGGTGFALTQLDSSQAVSAVGAAGVGWLSGTMAVAVVRVLTKRSVSSELGARELVGETGLLLLPVGPNRPGKVRVEVKGRAEDFVANVVEDGGDLPTGTPVLIVAEGDRGSLLVTKHEM
jgi:membrane protein implicated in regulation of membrane protease activity